LRFGFDGENFESVAGTDRAAAVELC
jgi:hypothetical protein